MKKLLYLGIILMLGSCGSNGNTQYFNNESFVIIDNQHIIQTVILGDFEITSEDIGSMNWDRAMEVCEDLGDGWRLPDTVEMSILWKHQIKNGMGRDDGGFDNTAYWSSTGIDVDNALCYYFNGGWGAAYTKETDLRTRAVRLIDKEKNDQIIARNKEERNSILESSLVKIGDLVITTKEFGMMNWDEAKGACEALGDGWRLPTMNELQLLYENKENLGFGKGYMQNQRTINNAPVYWSSEEAGENLIPDGGIVNTARLLGKENKPILFVWKMEFGSGQEDTFPIDNELWVLPVRGELPLEMQQKLEGNRVDKFSVKIGKLEVRRTDLSNFSSSWASAKRELEEIGGGWRLPTIDELQLLYENKEKIGGFDNEVSYWCSTENGGELYGTQIRFFDGEHDDGWAPLYDGFVRAVRSIEPESTTSNQSEHKLTELTEKDIDIELSLKEEPSLCLVKDIFKKNNVVYIVVDFITAGVEYNEEEGERWETATVVNSNPKLRTYKINLENGNGDIYFDSYSEIIELIKSDQDRDAVCDIETMNGEVIFLVNDGLPG